MPTTFICRNRRENRALKNVTIDKEDPAINGRALIGCLKATTDHKRKYAREISSLSDRLISAIRAALSRAIHS